MDVESIRSEVAFRFSRSSGPGGQHAQKSSTRVEALFDVEGSSGLTPAERERVLRLLGPVVRAIAQDERSQLRNREAAMARLADLVAIAIEPPPPPRRPTRPSKGAQQRRLDGKKRRGETKRLRQRPPD